LAVLALSLHTGCLLLPERKPQDLPDYDVSDVWILDYRVGDRFRTTKPMFLTTFGGTYTLNEPGIGAPDTNQYAKHPEDFRGYVVRLCPPGLEFTLVGIKETALSGALTYIEVPGVKGWVHVVLDTYTNVGYDVRVVYNRKLFEKIEHPSE